jgi:hypothetical protein
MLASLYIRDEIGQRKESFRSTRITEKSAARKVSKIIF